MAVFGPTAQTQVCTTFTCVFFSLICVCLFFCLSEYAGWQWKGDTSSDEVTGHMFGLPIAAHLLYPPGPQKDSLVTLITNIATYIVNNDYTLIDVTGLPTTWGHWDPPTLNYNRAFSDGRGLNSLQILAYMQAAVNQSSDPAAQALLARAYADLTGPSNEYNLNMLNLKIESPIDDNFSDDELTFLPYYTFLTNCGDPTRFVFKKERKKCCVCVCFLRLIFWLIFFGWCREFFVAGRPPSRA